MQCNTQDINVEWLTKWNRSIMDANELSLVYKGKTEKKLKKIWVMWNEANLIENKLDYNMLKGLYFYKLESNFMDMEKLVVWRMQLAITFQINNFMFWPRIKYCSKGRWMCDLKKCCLKIKVVNPFCFSKLHQKLKIKNKKCNQIRYIFGANF